MMMDDDDLFAHEKTPAPPPTVVTEPWPILVVDDDPQVHAMTRLLLKDFEFEGRPFAMIGALSAEEARAVLAARPDLPVVLLDVVMESVDAGLQLVHHIRRELGNRHIRIILRTGQPGRAPERDVIVAYDINDYKSKNDLTAQALFTSLISALRGWRDLVTIESLNQSLEHRVAERTAELARQRALADEQRRFIENLVEMMPSPVWYKDADGRCVIANRAFRELFHGALDGGSGVTPNLPPLPPDGRPLVFETSVTDAGGEVRELHIIKKRLASQDGAPSGLIGIATDITDRRRMERELRHLAITDPLSGIHNRRHLLDTLESAVRGSVEALSAFSLIMLDIDHFKRINDDYGHAAGDTAIKSVVAEIRRHLRVADAVGRIGGEEFAILLPETPLDAAARIAERLRAGLSGMMVVLADGRAIHLTASFGITELRRADETSEAVLHRADQALYRAKANGRNRVELN